MSGASPSSPPPFSGDSVKPWCGTSFPSSWGLPQPLFLPHIHFPVSPQYLETFSSWDFLGHVGDSHCPSCSPWILYLTLNPTTARLQDPLLSATHQPAEASSRQQPTTFLRSQESNRKQETIPTNRTKDRTRCQHQESSQSSQAQMPRHQHKNTNINTQDNKPLPEPNNTRCNISETQNRDFKITVINVQGP